jgi:hypothetical protein
LVSVGLANIGDKSAKMSGGGIDVKSAAAASASGPPTLANTMATAAKI